MPRVRRNLKPSIDTTILESRALLSDLPVVAPPAIIFSAPPAPDHVITGPIPMPVPAPYPSASQGPVTNPPANVTVDPTIPLPAGLTDPNDPIQSGDPLQVAPPRPYPTPDTTAPPTAPPSSGSPVPVPTPAVLVPLDVDPTRGIAPPTPAPTPPFPEPESDFDIDQMPGVPDDVKRLYDETLQPPPAPLPPPQIEIHEVTPTWQDWWDQIKGLVPYIPSPANTPMPVLP